MSLYDDTNPAHLDMLDRHRARWTPERAAQFERDFAAGKYDHLKDKRK